MRPLVAATLTLALVAAPAAAQQPPGFAYQIGREADECGQIGTPACLSLVSYLGETAGVPQMWLFMHSQFAPTTGRLLDILVTFNDGQSLLLTSPQGPDFTAREFGGIFVDLPTGAERFDYARATYELSDGTVGQLHVTPEPATVALLATGLLVVGGVGVAKRRGRRDGAAQT